MASTQLSSTSALIFNPLFAARPPKRSTALTARTHTSPSAPYPRAASLRSREIGSVQGTILKIGRNPRPRYSSSQANNALFNSVPGPAPRPVWTEFARRVKPAENRNTQSPIRIDSRAGQAPSDAASNSRPVGVLIGPSPRERDSS
ncbi:MAG: hypothetical protein CME06_02135 [Gemmatimonadetes bacterium]|nr:hypothetical protein [Gemmatimonadota bacterium]